MAEIRINQWQQASRTDQMHATALILECFVHARQIISKPPALDCSARLILQTSLGYEGLNNMLHD